MRLNTLPLLALTACGADPTSNLVATLGWTFDYRDWTKPNCADGGGAGCSEPDVRGCDNQPSANPGPRYDAVSQVQIKLDDPQAQLPPYDESFDCTRQEADIKGLVRQTYRL